METPDGAVTPVLHPPCDHHDMRPPSRRGFLELSAAAALVSGCKRREDAPGTPAPAPPVNAALVRVASVPTAVEGDLLPDLLAWDAGLKRQDINPGTSADLTVATLFAHRLSTILPPSSNGD